jgi:hypothetical protein
MPLFGSLLPNDFQPGFPSRLAPSTGSLAVPPSLLVSIIAFVTKIMPQDGVSVNRRRNLKRKAYNSKDNILIFCRVQLA